MWFFLNRISFQDVIPECPQQKIIWNTNTTDLERNSTLSVPSMKTMFKALYLERRYNETRNWPLPCYGKLKRMIKNSTNDVVISKCRVPVHEHSIKNMGDRKGKWVFVFFIWNFKSLQLNIKKLIVIFIIMKWWCEHTKTQKAQSRFEI